MRRWLLFVLLVIPFVVMLALVVEADDPSPEEGAPRNICLDPDTGDFLCPPTATPTPVPTLDPETCISHPQYCLTPAPTATPTPKPPTATPTPKPPTATPTPKPPTATRTPEPPTATAEPEATSAYLNPRPYNVRFDNRPTQWHEFTVKARGGAVYVRVNPTLTYTRLEISATDSPGDLCPPTRQQRIKRVEGDKVYLAVCSVGETYVELYTEGGTMKARYRVDVQRYTPSITPTPSPTAPPTATATAMATPTDTCPRPPGQGVVALGLGQQTIRGRWDGNDCLHFPVTASTRLHIVLMLRSFGRDPEGSRSSRASAPAARSWRTTTIRWRARGRSPCWAGPSPPGATP